MNKYQSYKQSGVEWIGEIPSNWSVTKIKYTKNDSKDSFIDGDWIESKDLSDKGIRYITSGNIGEGKYKEQGSGFISEDTFKELNCTEIFEGDLIISRLFLPVGRSCILPNLNKRVITCVDNVVLRPKESFNKSYLNYQFNSNRYSEFTELISRGVTLTRISRGMLGNNSIVVPPLSEQLQIVQFLDKKIDIIDKLISTKERKIILLKEQRKSLINQVVTKGLNPNVKMKDSGVEWIGEVPEHWSVVNFGRICNVRQGLQIPFDNRLSEKVENSYEYITTQSVHNPNQYKQYILNPKPNVICNENDILMGRTGNTGEVVTNVNGVFHNNFFLIDFKRKIINKEFLVSYLTNPRLREELLLLSGTTTIPDLNHGKFLSTKFVYPNLTEQDQIVKFLDEKTKEIDDLVQLEQKKIDLLKEYRQSLISEVVTGKIKVTN
jgi:type I restriction enzyme S subunit